MLHDIENPLLPERKQQSTLQKIYKFIGNCLVVIDSVKFCKLFVHTASLLPSTVYVAKVSVMRSHFDPSVGTEELGHLEMVGAIVHQLTRNLKDSQIQDSAFAPYFVDHTVGVYPQAASGVPFTAAFLQVKGDPITDLVEDMGAEQKARTTYDNILRLSDDPDVNDVIKFLREREVVHFQRFGEAVQLLREKLNQKNVYYMNPAFDM